MFRINIVIILLLTTFTCPAQDVTRAYVQKNTVPLRMEDKDSAWYRDMEAIGAAIGDASIVMLGEQSHGDAATFLVKSKLVKYLHEKKGFNVLAFESDFFALNAGWDAVPKDRQSIDSFLRYNPFPIWTQCHTCYDLLYNYIPSTFQTPAPLQVSGFDNQLHGAFSKSKLKPMLDSFLQKAVQLVPAAKDPAAALLKWTDSLMMHSKTEALRSVCDSFIKAGETILSLLQPLYTTDDFWLRVIGNAMEHARGLQYVIKKETANYVRRDRQMADNVLWLNRVKYPGEKIIIWAHNAHISKNSGNYFDGYAKYNLMMGHLLDSSRQLEGKVYILGFTSYEGFTRWTSTSNYNQKLKKPLKNSFENWIDPVYRFAFTDFRPFRKMNPGLGELFYMKGSTLGSHWNQQAKWTSIFDGVLFIREMYGCEIISNH